MNPLFSVILVRCAGSCGVPVMTAAVIPTVRLSYRLVLLWVVYRLLCPSSSAPWIIMTAYIMGSPATFYGWGRVWRIWLNRLVVFQYSVVFLDPYRAVSNIARTGFVISVLICCYFSPWNQLPLVLRSIQERTRLLVVLSQAPVSYLQ